MNGKLGRPLKRLFLPEWFMSTIRLLCESTTRLEFGGSMERLVKEYLD